MFRDTDSRDRDRSRDRSTQVTRAFARELALPHRSRREHVDDYLLRGSEVRTLATVGAFRVVPREDLVRQSPSAARELERLRQAGLVSTTPYKIGRQRMTIVTLTKDGLDLLERHRREDHREQPQAFYAGVLRPREIGHDCRLYAAFRDSERRLTRNGASVRRVVLEHELKRDYQRFLHESNRGVRHSTGRPRQDLEAVRVWATERDLPLVNDSVRFPDLRIEYERPDGTRCREDVEIVTENYRGAHAAATAAAGFNCRRYGPTRVGGSRSSTKGSRSRSERLAEEMWR